MIKLVPLWDPSLQGQIFDLPQNVCDLSFSGSLFTLEYDVDPAGMHLDQSQWFLEAKAGCKVRRTVEQVPGHAALWPLSLIPGSAMGMNLLCPFVQSQAHLMCLSPSPDMDPTLQQSTPLGAPSLGLDLAVPLMEPSSSFHAGQGKSQGTE